MPVSPAFLEIDLASEQGRGILSSITSRNAQLIPPAARLIRRMFLMRSPWAPGLRFVGAETHARSVEGDEFADIVFSLSGVGETLEDALVTCIGEGIDRLAQIEYPGDVTVIASLGEVEDRVLPSTVSAVHQELLDQVLPRATPLAWVEGKQLGLADTFEAGQNVLLPADWCVRRAAGKIQLRPRTALSVGVAAGPDLDWAAQRALLELIERDAASLWWIGGQPARSVALDHPAMAEIVRLLGVLRQDACERCTWLLDITTDIGIPTIAAVSCGPDGHKFACGLAARITIADAAQAAILELCQMELAVLVAEVKLIESGEQGLNAIDRGHLERAKVIDVSQCKLLHATGCPLSHRRPNDRMSLLPVREALLRAGVEVALLELTRPDLGIPVVRAFAPTLQPMPSTRVTDRLSRAVREWGGGQQYTQSVDLI